MNPLPWPHQTIYVKTALLVKGDLVAHKGEFWEVLEVQEFEYGGASVHLRRHDGLFERVDDFTCRSLTSEDVDTCALTWRVRSGPDRKG